MPMSAADLTTLTAAQAADLLAAGEITSEQLVRAHLERIEATGRADGLNTFLHVDAEGALATARAVDEDRAAGKPLHPLAGVPVAVKDNIVTTGQPTTAASKILDGWVSPYDATVVERIRQARMPILGKTNLDEFAMGSSTEHSAFGPTRNPWALDRIPGGSGGGAAAAVAAHQAPLALGTDTGGSIRQPASVTGSVGVHPTYGSVSRYGAIAMASSLDQIGPHARTVLDAALLHELIAGHDPKDSTSLPDEVGDFAAQARAGAVEGGIRGMRIGVIRQLQQAEGIQPGVAARVADALEALREAGAEIVEIDMPHYRYALGAYYLLMSSEVSSNLAKYDGVRWGLRVEPEEGPVTIERVMAATRAAGFGPEVKRRIILGTYALSAGYYDAYYGSAQKARTRIIEDFTAAFEQADVLVAPTSPTTAFRFGEKTDDPLSMYLSDIATIPINLAGVPAISVPAGLSEDDGLPVGVQFIAPVREDARMYRAAAGLEAALEKAWGAPLLQRRPAVEDLLAASGEADAEGVSE